jgi:hypothetical protein
VASANELRRLSTLATEPAVELVAALDAARRVVICNGSDGKSREGLVVLELRLDRRGAASGDVAVVGVAC